MARRPLPSHELLEGPARAPARAMLRGPVGPHCPASFLREHPHASVFLDEAAAAGFRDAFEN
jgi:6-phosphogluconolactonase/glucosamine-6-phosphate isomerase/deaminase